MKKSHYIIIILSLGIVLFFVYKYQSQNINSKFYQGTKNIRYEIPPQSSVFGIYHSEGGFNRLEKRYQNIVREPVWNLSLNSSGVSIKFRTNSSVIWVKWESSSKIEMPNMNNIGSNGLDIYVNNDSVQQFVDAAIPKGKSNEYLIAKNMDSTYKDFQLNLPLFNDITELEIGVETNSQIVFKNKKNTENPIIFYGTSITQGASASRPGMAYPAIISRIIGKETINLGFSGNGKFEIEIAEILCQIDAKLFVIDCTPNSPPELIRENTLLFLEKLNQCKSNIPILLIESIIREEAYINKASEDTFGGLAFIQAQNKELLKAYKEAKRRGISNIHYLNSENLIGFDHDATVDGTHLSDLGMYRIAKTISIEIQKILNDK